MKLPEGASLETLELTPDSIVVIRLRAEDYSSQKFDDMYKGVTDVVKDLTVHAVVPLLLFVVDTEVDVAVDVIGSKRLESLGYVRKESVITQEELDQKLQRAMVSVSKDLIGALKDLKYSEDQSKAVLDAMLSRASANKPKE